MAGHTMHTVARILFALPIVAFAAPATAQVMTTTINGIVGANNVPAADTDALGLFGPVGTNLNGQTMRVTLKFEASLMNEGGQSPGYSAWSGPSGSCQVTIGGVRAKPAVEKLVGINSNRIYFYSDVSGTWALDQSTDSSQSNGNACGVTVMSTKHPFVPSANLVQTFAYHPPVKEHLNGDNFLMDITVNGVRETVSADVTSVKYSQ
jgi:hypothetical protein